MSSHLPAPPPSPRAGPRRSPRHLPGMEPHLCWAPPGADAEMPEDAKMLPPPAWEAWAEMVSGTLMAPPPPPAVARAARRNLRVQRRAAASATAALGFISLADASRDQIEAQGLPGRKRPRGWADSHSGSSDSEPRRADEETEMQNFKLDALTQPRPKDPSRPQSSRGGAPSLLSRPESRACSAGCTPQPPHLGAGLGPSDSSRCSFVSLSSVLGRCTSAASRTSSLGSTSLSGPAGSASQVVATPPAFEAHATLKCPAPRRIGAVRPSRLVGDQPQAGGADPRRPLTRSR